MSRKHKRKPLQAGKAPEPAPKPPADPTLVKHIAFTMYPVLDMARARGFYEGALELKATSNYKDAWVEYHLENGCFAITTMAEGVSPSASAGGSIAFEVGDVDATLAKLRAKGATVKVEPFATPVCRMAILLDLDGNAFCIHARNKTV